MRDSYWKGPCHLAGIFFSCAQSAVGVTLHKFRVGLSAARGACLYPSRTPNHVLKFRYIRQNKKP